MKLLIEESTLQQIGQAIREKGGANDRILGRDLAARIMDIPSGGGDVEPIVLTGSCNYGCSGKLSSQFINLFGNKISTNDVTTVSYMFYQNTCERIPFEINMDKTTYFDFTGMFHSCEKLKELPKINNAYPSAMNAFLTNCRVLEYIPEDYFDNWNFSRVQSNNYANMSAMFSGCNSLRRIPQHLLNNLWGIQTTSSYCFYYNMLQSCNSMDEINGIPIQKSNFNSNVFGSYTFSACARLKNVTFAMNEDGTPQTVNWKKQTIDLSSGVGYDSYSSMKFTYITEDKKVTDDASYQALKDDPDWFTYDINYSRYNHDSAVNTINSLPDCSATGTNTIKFKGAAGALTDGGAINTLTEAEIAVAAAKGWTVSLV